jgi:hypothetical protein
MKTICNQESKMKYKNADQFKTQFPILILPILIFFILAIGLACNSPDTTDVTNTQVALNVQSTQLALKETQLAQEAASQGQIQQDEVAAQNESGPDLQATQNAQAATQMALDLQSTANALQMTQAVEAAMTQEVSEKPVDQPESEPVSNMPDFDTWMKSANILLYEDMSGDFSVYRFIQGALDSMGLSYTDVKDALGHYKNQLLSAGPGGQGWDLIISGKELRTSVQGEFYVYINDALNLGSSVIIEEWDMDSIASGKLSTILSRCGVEFQRDWIDEPLNEHLLYPIKGTHPIHHFPNEGISLTNPTGYWIWTDLGDLMKLSPGSDAQLLWGVRVNIKDSYATAVSCMEGQLIIQSYSSHSYGQDRIERMWQNYIYNTLQARYDYLSTK